MLFWYERFGDVCVMNSAIRGFHAFNITAALILLRLFLQYRQDSHCCLTWANLNLNATFKFITDTFWNIVHVLEPFTVFPLLDYEYSAKLSCH